MSQIQRLFFFFSSQPRNLILDLLKISKSLKIEIYSLQIYCSHSSFFSFSQIPNPNPQICEKLFKKYPLLLVSLQSISFSIFLTIFHPLLGIWPSKWDCHREENWLDLWRLRNGGRRQHKSQPKHLHQPLQVRFLYLLGRLLWKEMWISNFWGMMIFQLEKN